MAQTPSAAAIADDGNYAKQLSAQYCANGAHIIFLGNPGMGSTTMRAIMPLLALNQTRRQLHNASTTYFAYAAKNDSVALFKHHVRKHGAPSVCVMIKYFGSPLLREACQMMGAVTLLDCIDNHRCFDTRSNAKTMRSFDSVLVQTSEHLHLLERNNISAEIYPHPHGDYAAPRPPPPTRSTLRSVGFLFSDPMNMPNKAHFDLICRACQRANLSLYTIMSPWGLSLAKCPPLNFANVSNATAFARPAARNASHHPTQAVSRPRSSAARVRGRRLTAAARLRTATRQHRSKQQPVLTAAPHVDSHGLLDGEGNSATAPNLSCQSAPVEFSSKSLQAMECGRTDMLRRGSSDNYAGTDASVAAGTEDTISDSHVPSVLPPLPVLVDHLGQARYYNSTATRRIRKLIDVAVVWPGKRRYGGLFDANRPPTRFHYWLALGIPVIGYPVNAYVEAAERLNYPVELVSLRTEEQLLSGLCALASGERRACLQQTVLPAAAQLASPLNSALQLVSISCKVAARRGGLKNRRGDDTEPSVQSVREVLHPQPIPADD